MHHHQVSLGRVGEVLLYSIFVYIHIGAVSAIRLDLNSFITMFRFEKQEISVQFYFVVKSS